MKKLARETIAALERWSGRLEGHFTEKRATNRSRCYRMIYVTVPEEFADYIKVGVEGMAEGVTRNISTTGVGFLLKQRLPADRLTICFHQDNGDWLKIEGKVVRHRKVHNGYWEYGVEFMRRADGE